MHYVYIDWTEETIPRPFYVGQGDDHRLRRVKRNPKHTNVKNKYGLRREVALSTEDVTHALIVERQLIAQFHTFVDDPMAPTIACNWTPGGEGCKHANTTKARISESVKRQWSDPDFREQRCKAMRGKLRTDETKKRLSEAGKGRKLSPETIAKRSLTNTGSTRSSSTREKMREARRLWWAQRRGEV